MEVGGGLLGRRAGNERLSVDGPKGISADSAAIYEHCEQASSERL